MNPAELLIYRGFVCEGKRCVSGESGPNGPISRRRQSSRSPRGRSYGKVLEDNDEETAREMTNPDQGSQETETIFSSKP